ncbi:GNAT family N-acetyltransferase [Paenibacillus sp. 481]|uniref:GNAT family N-acetyltransferase n=1 Tax=Paenibacillus sp. 481 TaxID=2835869 RepID=UPI001E38F1E2|nr:GNAT family N-acetyltransferase [Paenibacillus sp. 481]UHA74665.1 GNAT family N-acetyltransferase [Paenibacillus sp. 481]
MNHTHTFTIDTDSIRLRTFSTADYEELHQLTRQSEITDILPDWNMTEEQLEQFLSFVVGSYEKFDPHNVQILLAVEHKEDKRLIGWCGVFPNDLLDPAAREVAYAISKDYRNQGYTTSVVRAIASFVFANTELARIVAIVKPFNVASRRVVEKAGFDHIRLTKLADQQEYDYFEMRKHTAHEAEETEETEETEKTEETEGDINNMMIQFRRAQIEDAAQLSALMKRTFDQEIQKWHTGDGAPDSNLRPPGYDSLEMHRYLTRELDYYAIVLGGIEGTIIGGISVESSGKRHARLDKIFIDPSYQGRGLGSKAIAFIESEFPAVEEWRLETSSRQINNHFFYEKAGYVRTYESEDEYVYEKIMAGNVEHSATAPSKFKDQNLSHTQFESCAMNGADFYKMNVEKACYSNSNLSGSQFTDCNLSHSTFKNMNLTNVLLADLRLSNSEIALVSLDGVRFHDTNLGASHTPMTFERCDLRGTEIRGSNLSNVNIDQCNISGMKINGIPVEELLRAYEQTNGD